MSRNQSPEEGQRLLMFSVGQVLLIAGAAAAVLLTIEATKNSLPRIVCIAVIGAFLGAAFIRISVLRDGTLRFPFLRMQDFAGFVAPIGIPWGLTVHCPTRMYKGKGYIVEVTADKYSQSFNEEGGEGLPSFLVNADRYTVEEHQEDTPRIVGSLPQITVELLAPGLKVDGDQRQTRPLRLRYAPRRGTNAYPIESQWPQGFVPERTSFQWGVFAQDSGCFELAFVLNPEPPEAFKGLYYHPHKVTVTVFELNHLSRTQLILLGALCTAVTTIGATVTIIYTMGKIFSHWN